MKNVQIVVPELFLPQQVAKSACAGLALGTLEKFLAHAEFSSMHSDSLESWLCEAFGQADQAIAPLTLQSDGVPPGAGYWLRADPVHISLQREHMILQVDVAPTPEEAALLCASLNAHFAADGLRFVAPHSQRWYVQLATAPDMQTRPLSQVAGRNVYAHMPQGRDALRWHAVFNEIQMLFFAHEVNQAREERGELAINSVWLWGGGVAAGVLLRPYAKVIADGGLALAFAAAAEVSSEHLSEGRKINVEDADGDVLLVWEGLHAALQRGDLDAWQRSVQQFELACMQPLLLALQAGKIDRIILEVPAESAARRYVLTRAALWKLWRLKQPLSYYAQV